MTDDDFWAGHRSGWNEDPQLVDPEIAHASRDFARHWPTGAVVASYSVRGRWSNAAFEQLRKCLDFALPGRYSCRVVGYGNARFSVFLGTVRGEYSQTYESNHVSDIDETARCAAWAFNYTVLTELGGSVADAGSVGPLPRPEPRLAEAFRLAELDIGDGFPSIYSTSSHTWSELRHSAHLDKRHLLYSYCR